METSTDAQAGEVIGTPSVGVSCRGLSACVTEPSAWPPRGVSPMAATMVGVRRAAGSFMGLGGSVRDFPARCEPQTVGRFFFLDLGWRGHLFSLARHFHHASLRNGQSSLFRIGNVLSPPVHFFLASRPFPEREQVRSDQPDHQRHDHNTHGSNGAARLDLGTTFRQTGSLKGPSGRVSPCLTPPRSEE